MKPCESVELTKLTCLVSPIGEHFRSRKGFVVSFQFCQFLFSFLLPLPRSLSSVGGSKFNLQNVCEGKCNLFGLVIKINNENVSGQLSH